MSCARWVGAAAAILLSLQLACPAPFHALPLSLVQPDGTPVQVFASGDEFYAVVETAAGYAVVLDAGRDAYCYAALDRQGAWVSTGQQIHRVDPTTLGLPPHLRESAEVRRQKTRARWERWEGGMQVTKAWKARGRKIGDPQSAPPSFNTVGTKVGLTLLIDFDDAPASIPRAEVLEFCNGENYTGFGNNGSVRRYFDDNSNGLLNYSNIVTVYIRIPNTLHPRSWYDDENKDCGGQGNLLVRDAVQILKALPNYATEILPTFQDLTVDASNQVVACNVLFAGNSQFWGAGLWQHSWALVEVGAQELSPGGIKLWRYQATPMGNALKLGIFCHENGHMLCGFPDIYDYDGDSRGGAGQFCLMNSGAFEYNPVQLCAYLKRAAGWATTVELSSSSAMVATLSAVAGPRFNQFYRYQRPGVPTEYFLLEARYATGRDAGLPASGVAIWHIDELGARDNQNTNFNSSHLNYEVSLEQADDLREFQRNQNSGNANDLYSSQNNAAGYVNSFSDTTGPSARWWDGTLSEANFHNFSPRGTTMTFLAGTILEPLIVTQPTGVEVMQTKPAAFSIGVAGATPLHFQWYYQGNLITGATNATYSIAEVDWTNQGAYRVTVTNQHGQATSDTVQLTVLPFISYAEALDTTNLTWTTSGSAPWITQAMTSQDGVDAAQSGTIGHTQQSLLETTLNGPGLLQFWWKVSSEAIYDKLELYIDGLLQSGAISGEADWQQKRLSIPGGAHTLRWRYSKDTSDTRGQDRGWVDQVSFTPSIASPLGEALDQPGLTWQLGGATAWTGQSLVTHDGVDAAESGLISHSQESWIQVTNLAGAGTLKFWWRVSSETNRDYLEFYLNGTLQPGRISGEEGWSQQAHSLPEGISFLRWRYSKNSYATAGQDRGWVDQVTFIPSQPLVPHLENPRLLNGEFLTSLSGSPGGAYRITVSSNGVDWLPVVTNAAPFTFCEPVTAGSRWFRAHSAQ